MGPREVVTMATPEVSNAGMPPTKEQLKKSEDVINFGVAGWDLINCSRTVPELLKKFEDYVPLWDVSAPHVLDGVRAQLRPAGWRNMLSGGPDAVYGEGWDINSLFLLDGVINGFKIVDPGAKIAAYETQNYSSATVDAFSFIDDIISSELCSGKLSKVDYKPHCVHALGAVEKSSGGFRPITDASRPELSINAYMEKTFNNFKFTSMDEICEKLTPGCFLGVTDISAAYRSVLIRATDREYQGLCWVIDGRPTYIRDNFLAFGTRVSPYVFNSLTDAVSRYMNASGFMCYNYLDDFLVVGDTYADCQRAQLVLHGVLRELGFYIAYKKVLSPSCVQRYLGIIIDTHQMKLFLPQDKLQKLKEELAFFDGRRQATRRQLQRLCGILGHCATLVRGGRTFSHRIIGMLSAFSPSKRRITLSKNFFLDIQWWKTFAAWFNGEARMVGQQVQDNVLISMDASGTGYGVVYDADWLAGAWKSDLSAEGDVHSHFCSKPDTEVPDNINVQELYPLIEAMWRWGRHWANCKILCLTDNTQVVAGINSGKSSNAAAMGLLRRLFWLTVIYNCQIVAYHVPGKSNVYADALSRLLQDGVVVPEPFCCRCKPVVAVAGSEGG